jgi:hypothetical protein
METSAKTSEGVEQTFILAAKMLYKKHLSRIKQAKMKLQEKKNNRLKPKDHSGAANRPAGGCTSSC